MRAWDVKRLLDAFRLSDGSRDQELILSGPATAGVWALWAAVFAPDVDEVRLIDPPTTVHDGPAMLNLERILDMPQAIALMAPRQVVVKTVTSQPPLSGTRNCVQKNPGQEAGSRVEPLP